MSIVRPTSAQTARRWVVLACAVFAVVAAYGQMAVGWGQTPQEFSADSDATLRVAGYAFSIWGLIYLGLLVYAVRQVLPQTGESLLIHRLGWPSAAALLGIDGETLRTVELGLLAGTPGLAAIGIIIAALTVGLRGGAALSGLMLIPLAVPLLVFGAGALSTGGAGGIALTGAISLLLLAIAPFAGGAAIRAAREN